MNEEIKLNVANFNIPVLDKLSAPCIGRLAGSNKSGQVIVEINGRTRHAARHVSGLSRFELLKEEKCGKEVLIVFENGNPEKPIILALMEDPLENLMSIELKDEESQRPIHAMIDGKRVKIQAENEIVLVCGKSEITLKKDGKIVIKGKNLLSRSSGSNRIKGASVNIN